MSLDLTPRAPDPRLSGIIKLAIMAVGGQGGGVLTNWIEDLARSNGYAAQATSVAGVSQRTGATIYYVEMAPCGPGERAPMFSLMPSAGDVDVLIAAEMMEAGRAILRGFVTPDRTTLIASSHRALAVSEKMVPGDGIASSEEVQRAAEVAAARLVMFDMDGLAVKNGSVISASLFGALAGSGALPFPRAAFEAAVAAGGKGVEASLRAFRAAADRAEGLTKPEPAQAAQSAKAAITGPARLLSRWQSLAARAEALPEAVREMAGPGLAKVTEFMDLAYGEDYLARVEAAASQDRADKGHAYSRTLAKYLANAMAYDDVIRVASAKTRGSRMGRIAREMGRREGQEMQITEFLHPRAEEITGMLPVGLATRLSSDKWQARIGRWFATGKRLRTDRLSGFLMLYVLGGLKTYRRRTLRHAQEVAHRDAWLARAEALRAAHYDLAVEVLATRRLVKGYSDTHARGLSKFDRVMEAIRLVEGRDDAADWARRLREAALADEQGKALDGAIATIRSFV